MRFLLFYNLSLLIVMDVAIFNQDSIAVVASLRSVNGEKI